MKCYYVFNYQTINKMKSFAFFILFLFIFSHQNFAQRNPELGDPYTNWDGFTHWTKYQIVSSAYFGPNALPVPEITTGYNSSVSEFEISAVNHFSKRDNTPNLFLRYSVPIAKSKVLLEFYAVPIEYFNMDTALRHERRTFMKLGKGVSQGDLYFSTNVQITKNHAFLPDLLFRMACKTTSGEHLKEARYTDAPAYFFDLSSNKRFRNHNSLIDSCEIFTRLGFYCWQTNIDNNPQDDALLFGVGFNLFFSDFVFNCGLGSYIGYINNGDQPIVQRFSLRKRNKKIDYLLSFEAGIHDYKYNTVKFGIIYHR